MPLGDDEAGGRGMSSDDLAQPTECRLVDAVADIAGFMRAAAGKSNLDTFRMLDEFYRLVEESVARAGGKVVKYTREG